MVGLPKRDGWHCWRYRHCSFPGQPPWRNSRSFRERSPTSRDNPSSGHQSSNRAPRTVRQPASTAPMLLKSRGGDGTLVFQSLGYITQSIPVRPNKNRRATRDAVALEAVVAIGYGSVKQKDLTTAVSVVKTDDLVRRPITSVSAALQGKAAGVQVLQPNGSPGQGMVVRVRGASSISSSNDPLYVVDAPGRHRQRRHRLSFAQ